MTDIARSAAAAPRSIFDSDWMIRVRRGSEALAIPIAALLVSALLFSVFLLALGKSPVQFFQLIWLGGFGTGFSWSNTLLRAAPVMLTALAVAIPARLGLTMIGGEGALVLGGFAAAAVAIPLIGGGAPLVMHLLMFAGALAVGAAWVGLAGALRQFRGVNETISTLLLSYIAIAIMNFFVEGALRDPADPNKPSTKALEILVAFLARQHPLAIVPVAILFGGIAAAGGIIQRRMGLPDATVLLLQGLTFVVLLASETFYGRLAIFNPKARTERT
jgi:ABC-type uncharacterized transport system permease subunit